MVRADFDRNLRLLQNDLLSLGQLVSQAISQSMRALSQRDHIAAEKVVAADDVIDERRFQLEEQCIDLIATQQPTAIDLRTLMAVLHISVELERMGDYAEGIAKISLMMESAPSPDLLRGLPELAERGNGMLHGSLESLVRRDVRAAEAVCAEDDQVDRLYEQVFQGLLNRMAQNPRSIKVATYLLWVAHDLERIADRATNIAERVIFLVTGKLPEVGASSY